MYLRILPCNIFTTIVIHCVRISILCTLYTLKKLYDLFFWHNWEVDFPPDKFVRLIIHHITLEDVYNFCVFWGYVFWLRTASQRGKMDTLQIILIRYPLYLWHKLIVLYPMIQVLLDTNIVCYNQIRVYFSCKQYVIFSSINLFLRGQWPHSHCQKLLAPSLLPRPVTWYGYIWTHFLLCIWERKNCTSSISSLFYDRNSNIDGENEKIYSSQMAVHMRVYVLEVASIWPYQWFKCESL